MIILGSAMLAVSACSSQQSVHKNDYIYRGINFGADRNEAFKKGVVDACTTADGDYTKDDTLFHNNEDYRMGWGSGRLQCKGK